MTELLAVRDVSAGYGATVVLDRVSFGVETGTTLAVLGRNGVGKTTLLTTIVGHTTFRDGTMTFAGQPIARLKPYQRARLGIGLVPQEREIFPSLTVEENLTVAARGTQGWTLERIYALLPNLAERRRGMGNQLSGGEQQMLAIGRALMGNPTLLLLDEPLEGLAPVIVDRLLEALRRLRTETGLTMILTEQQAQTGAGVQRSGGDFGSRADRSRGGGGGVAARSGAAVRAAWRGAVSRASEAGVRMS